MQRSHAWWLQQQHHATSLWPAGIKPQSDVLVLFVAPAGSDMMRFCVARVFLVSVSSFGNYVVVKSMGIDAFVIGQYA